MINSIRSCRFGRCCGYRLHGIWGIYKREVICSARHDYRILALRRACNWLIWYSLCWPILNYDQYKFIHANLKAQAPVLHMSWQVLSKTWTSALSCRCFDVWFQHSFTACCTYLLCHVLKGHHAILPHYKDVNTFQNNKAADACQQLSHHQHCHTSRFWLSRKAYFLSLCLIRWCSCFCNIRLTSPDVFSMRLCNCWTSCFHSSAVSQVSAAQHTLLPAMSLISTCYWDNRQSWCHHTQALSECT